MAEMAWWMFLPGKNANWDGSRMLFCSSAPPNRFAITLFIMRPMMGLTVIGLRLVVLDTCAYTVFLSALGRPVMMPCFSGFGRSPALKEASTIIRRSLIERVG